MHMDDMDHKFTLPSLPRIFSCSYEVLDLMQGMNVFQDARLLTLSWPFYPKYAACVEAIAEQQ